jgi:hypothetical protein
MGGMDGTYMEITKNFTWRLYEGLLVERGHPGVEALDEPDVLDAVVELKAAIANLLISQVDM